jgi:hypothetical protein
MCEGRVIVIYRDIVRNLDEIPACARELHDVLAPLDPMFDHAQGVDRDEQQVARRLGCRRRLATRRGQRGCEDQGNCRPAPAHSAFSNRRPSATCFAASRSRPVRV